MQPLDVVGVRLEMPSNQPVVLLQQSGSNRYLPIWVGTVEATAIAFALEGVAPPRPMTHDLIKELLGVLGDVLTEVRITDLTDGVFYANLVFESGKEIGCRPSDAIALALRTGASIVGADEVLAEASVEIEEESAEQPDEQELERFREFLDDVTPEDFGTDS
ncbi:MAG: hypothetical protein CMH41_06600 [Micrococcales bacterium]|nr:hypothetical protein [Micrococcales bacterium]